MGSEPSQSANPVKVAGLQLAFRNVPVVIVQRAGVVGRADAGLPVASSQAANASGPMASINSNGPRAQLKPQRSARSTLTISSAIAGTRSAA